MEVQVAVSKTRKYASSDSGDTVEVVERPHGGLSVVMADGQTSGRGAKSVSNLVVRKVISLLAEGVRDGASARAASDYLFAEKSGKVSATLNIISIDKLSKTIVITRNNPAPVLVVVDSNVHILDEKCLPVGLYRDTRPVICEFPLNVGMVVVAYTDGIVHAGDRYGQSMDIPAILTSLIEEGIPSPQVIADNLLNQAVELDHNRPADDISVCVLCVTNHVGDAYRRMSVRLPMDG